MKKYFRGLCLLLVCLCFSAVFLATNVQATKKKATKIQSENRATFMLMPEIPANNIGGAKLGYFNLKVKKGRSQSVRIKVFNPTAHAINIQGKVEDATTNDDASVDYLGTNQINKQLLKMPGSQWVTVPKKTVLPAGATKWIEVKVSPLSDFKGIKSTAVILSADQVNQKSAVKNVYHYAIGLIMNGQKITKRDYRYVKTPTIKTRFVKKKAAISIKVNNPAPMYLDKTRVDVSLKNQKWALIKYQTHLTNGEVAPNSSFYINLLLGGKRLVPGTYSMTMTVKNTHYQRTLHKEVAISKSQARYINRYNAIYLRNRHYILLAVLVLVIVCCTVVYKIYVGKKRAID